MVFAVLLFLWVAFCRLIVPDSVSTGVSAVLRCATSRVRTACCQLSPEERVDHLICNSDDAFIEHIGKFFGLGLFCLPLSVLGWLHTYEDTWGPLLWSLRTVSPAIFLFCSIGTVRAVLRAVKRKRIITSLNTERDRMDPLSRNPRIFISRRDSERLARVLFDRMTAACYRRGMTVLQYSDFAWPYYNKRWPAGGQGYSENLPEPYSQSRSNPDAVRAASILVWLDIGKNSPAVQLELETARQAQIPVVCLHSLNDCSETIVVSRGAHIYCTATFETAVESAVSVLEGILSAQTSRR
jgi:hypothetical protein